MVNISPILKEKLNNNYGNTPSNKANQQKMYEDIVRHANEVKPNEAKAKLVKEGPIASVGSYFKDLKQDTVNIYKAVRTGKMNDNSLGRINDLGLKLGAVLIATYLAAHSKTKTEAIMRFVGGGSFLAAMSLWPKLFINLPAKIVHGFDIDQKYISAQGDKKDFFLDNQFLPWDTYSDEELAEIGKHTGIDINSENGKEKIQRKMQKVALQNRTLWMATAGFATPLMTALFCDQVEPHIRNAVIDSNFKRAYAALFPEEKVEAKGIAKGFEAIKGVITKNKPAPTAKKAAKETKTAIETFFQTKDITDKGFFEELSSLLRIDDIKLPKENAKPIGKFTFDEKGTVAALQELFAQKATIANDKETLTGILENKYPKISKEKIDTVVAQIMENPTLANFKKIINDTNGMKRNEAFINKLAGELDVDATPFKTTVNEFFKTTIQPARENLKSYLGVLNDAIGEVAESKSTQFIVGSLSDLLKALNIDEKTLQQMINEPRNDKAAEILQDYFVKTTQGIEYGSENYKNLINRMLKTNLSEKEATGLKGFIGKIGKRFGRKTDSGIFDKVINRLQENIQGIKPAAEGETKNLSEAVQGKGYNSLYANLKNYIKIRKTDISSFASRAALCANFESRLNAGKIQVEGFGDLRNNKELLEAARKLIYQGNQSLKENQANLSFANKETVYKNLMKAIFDDAAFEQEPDILKQMAKAFKLEAEMSKNQVSELVGNGNERYIRNLDVGEQIKAAARRVMNNKAWKKTFIPMAIALVAITLLLQPFFGKIKKEYPEKTEGEKKNDKSN